MDDLDDTQNLSIMADEPLMDINNHSLSNSSIKEYYDPNKDECTLFARLVINTVITGGVCVLGLAGNAISFAVLRKDKQTPVASFLLQALALTDSFFLGLWFVHFSLTDVFAYAHIDQYSHKVWIYIRLYTYPFLFIGQTATIWLTVLIASTRFIAICIPYKAAQLCSLINVKKYVIGITLTSLVYNLPRFFDTKIVNVMLRGKEKYYFALSTLGESGLYRLLYLDIAYYIFSFALPVVFLAILNIKLTVAYHRLHQRRQNLRGLNGQVQRRNSLSHPDPSITLVMIIVVLVFMLCNLPARVVQIVWMYRDQKCLSPQFFVKEISNVMEVLNSSVNFIIYCVFRQQFRDILSKQLCQMGITSAQQEENISMQRLVNGHKQQNGKTNVLPV